ncbi:carboxylesterase/lipase family protein [Rhizorhabdus sp. FW153]|uniref:carboxylesterase/lipase family protein n=1 Tax=Rhizorhabdus sp. FW153 TaxID=3400216 RepID=UPI003CF91D11
MDRRTFLASTALIAAHAPALAAAGRSSGDTGGIAETCEGPVRGVATDNGTAYFGIPFAAPPIGPLRFRSPRPPARRTALFDATGFAPAPLQQPPAPGLYGPGPLPQSEDCLALNIWTPATPGPHPVYLWIHGGGNVAGSSRMPVFDGSRFARHGIVCVTISYRVGALGFLDISSLLGADYAGSGNNGLLDIVEALRWVRANIAAFGGDPRQVTIGGQSAGAKNVCALLAMPAARGLFSRAIVQSGGAETAIDKDGAARMARAFAELTGASDARDLLTLDGAALLAAQLKLLKGWPRKYPFRAVVDGSVLPDLPLSMIRDGRAAPVPLLIGTTRDEIAFFGPNAARDGTVVQGDLANMAIEAFAPAYDAYTSNFPALSPVDRRYRALTAEEYWLPTLRTAAAHASARRPTWLYRLDMPRGAAPNAGYAVHGSELPLVWDKVRDPQSAFLGPEGPAAEALARRMHAHWISFIRSGKPGADWPLHRPDAPQTMVFDAKDRPVTRLDEGERSLWDGARFDVG